jgi:hypothetical protein
MTDGTFETMTEHQIIAHVLAHPYTEPHDDKGDSQPGDTAGGPGGGPGGGSGGQGGGGSGGQGGGKGDGEPGDASDDSEPAGCAPGEGVSDDSSGDPGGPPVGDGPSDGAPSNRSHGRPAGDSSGGGARSPMTARSATRWSTPEVRIELGTLLGIDEHPGEIPPWGYLPAAQARHLVDGMHTAQWRYVFCDPAGRAIAGGLLRARPTTGSSEPVRRDSRRGGIVEIAVPAGHLARIATTQPTGPWEPVLAELARHAEQRGRDPDTDITDSTRRAAGAVLRRWIALRDRQCVHPCCRAPARTTDQDHRIGHAQGGPTVGTNLSTPCRHDHRLKDEAGWAIHQPEPGLTVWTSPLGHRYQSRRPPVTTAVPEPYPDDQRRLDEPVGLYIWISRPAASECDERCDCEPQILPPVPTRAPRENSLPDPKPTTIFDPNETFPF